MPTRALEQTFVPTVLAYAALCAGCALLMGCSDPGGTPGGNGGMPATGGIQASGGQSGPGGSTGSGGAGSGGASTLATGGVVSSGGTVRTGGASATGGGLGMGGQAGGAAGAGGTTRTAGMSGSGGSSGGGGTVATGGATAVGGGDGGVDAQTGGNATGGVAATGGATGTGGVATGGTTGTGGTGGSSDRCDVGVHDPASPPKVLSLSGSLVNHDPTAIKADGTYYLFCTGLGAGTSTNLTTWRSASQPFAAPAWMKSTITGVGDLWAPDISQFGGKFHLYYSGSTFGSNKSCIGHATRDSLATGAWVDDGAATICSNVNSNDNWNAIDPNLFIDTDGKYWLTLGSFWSGLKIIALDTEGKRVGTTVTSIANRPNNGGALEAPFLVRRCGYYYLFMSWDSCCKGADSTYNIRVVRGTSVTGPFADKAGTAALQGGGTLIAQGSSTWAGPGGQSVMFDGNQAYLIYHAYARSNGAITLRIAELVWDSSGWPVPVGP